MWSGPNGTQLDSHLLLRTPAPALLSLFSSAPFQRPTPDGSQAGYSGLGGGMFRFSLVLLSIFISLAFSLLVFLVSSFQGSTLHCLYGECVMWLMSDSAPQVGVREWRRREQKCLVIQQTLADAWDPEGRNHLSVACTSPTTAKSFTRQTPRGFPNQCPSMAK